MRRKNRDITIEVLRIIACMMVIFTHVKLGMTAGDVPDRRRILITVLAGDGVSLFWCIAGCFYFSGKKKYSELIRHTLVRIGIPMLLFCMVLFWFGGFLFGGVSLAQSIGHSPQEWKDLLVRGLLGGYCVIPRTDHLWYLMVYFIIILLYPLLRGGRMFLFPEMETAAATGEERKVSFSVQRKEWILVLVMFAVLTVNDITGNALLQIRHQGLGGVAGAVPMMVLGAVFYHQRERFSRNRKWGMIGLFLFAAVCLLWMETEYRWLLQDLTYENRQCRINAFGYIKMLSVFLAVFGFSGLISAGERLRKIIVHLGRLSFYIYLLHFPMLTFLDKTSVRARAAMLLNGSAAGEFAYPLILAAALLVFTVPAAEICFLAERFIQTGLLSGKK